MSLRYAVLGLVAQWSGCSGYDLTKVFEVSMAHVWSATQSQIYGELGKLAADGLLEVTGEGPRGRKEYNATPEGRTELHRWLTETRPRTSLRDEGILRVFLLHSLDPEDRRAYLRSQADEAAAARAELENLEASVDWDGPGDPGLLALEYGKRAMTTRQTWATWAITQVDRGPES